MRAWFETGSVNDATLGKFRGEDSEAVEVDVDIEEWELVRVGDWNDSACSAFTAAPTAEADADAAAAGNDLDALAAALLARGELDPCGMALALALCAGEPSSVMSVRGRGVKALLVAMLESAACNVLRRLSTSPAAMCMRTFVKNSFCWLGVATGKGTAAVVFLSLCSNSRISFSHGVLGAATEPSSTLDIPRDSGSTMLKAGKLIRCRLMISPGRTDATFKDERASAPVMSPRSRPAEEEEEEEEETSILAAVNSASFRRPHAAGLGCGKSSGRLNVMPLLCFFVTIGVEA